MKYEKIPNYSGRQTIYLEFKATVYTLIMQCIKKRANEATLAIMRHFSIIYYMIKCTCAIHITIAIGTVLHHAHSLHASVSLL